MFSFNGRIGRLALLGYGLIAGLVVLFGTVAAMTLSPNAEVDGISTAGLVPFLLSFVVAFWIGLAASVKRCHDLDKSGFFVLTTYIPIVGFFFNLYILLAPGTPGSNRYGYQGGSSPHAGGMSPRERHIAQFS